MSPNGLIACLLSIIAALAHIQSAMADELLQKVADKKPPVTGKKTAGVEFLDPVMLKYMDKIGCSAATLAGRRRLRVDRSRHNAVAVPADRGFLPSPAGL